MRKGRRFIFLLILSLGILYISIYPQSRENGAIQGKVTADTGEFLPGAEVKLSSTNLIGGDQFVITNESGKFRFVALPPGTYFVTVKLEGFTPARKEDIRLHTEQTLTVDLVLKIGQLTQEVVVMGKAPLVDVKDSQTGSVALSTEYLRNIPNSQDSAALINLAPGVTNLVAYGGAQQTSSTFYIDGGDISDPGDGSGYRLTNMDYNTIEEAKVSGIGSNAEYDGFTGAVLSTVTKSGGNEFEGDINFLYSNTDWNSDNTGDTGLSNPPSTTLYDISAHLGGPIKKDKLWFFGGLQYKDSKRQQLDFPKPTTKRQPLIFLKFTWQATKSNKFQVHFNYQDDRGDYGGGGPRRAIETTYKRQSYIALWNANWLHVFSDETFLEAKVSGWNFDAKRFPKGGNDVPGHVDYLTKWRTVNTTGQTNYYAWLNNVNVTASHHAENFLGSHDFKIGVETKMSYEHDVSWVPGGRYYLDYGGEPFYMYAYEGLENRYSMPLRYEVNVNSATYSGFAQDSWSVTDKLTVNLGLRYNTWKIKFEDRPDQVYKPSGFAPRIGFSYDLFGDHSTALKAHYGRYYEHMQHVAYYSLTPGNADFVQYKWMDGDWVEVYRRLGSLPDGTTPTSMDPNIKSPCIDQFTIGISRELIKDVAFEISYINRVSRNIIDTVNLDAVYEKVLRTDPFTGAIYEVYNQKDDPTDDRFMITNAKTGQTASVIVGPTKKYNGLQFLLTKRFSNNWQLITSYVYSTLRGTFDNSYVNAIPYGSSDSPRGLMFSADPNYQINSEGKFTYDPTHVFKIQGMVAFPLNVNLSANFYLVSGDNYTRMLRVGDLTQGSIELRTEQKGSRRLPTRTNLDIRLEKVFNLGGLSLGLTFDVFNAFNSGTATAYLTDAGPEFGVIDGIVEPRSFRVGFRFFF